MNVLSNLLKKLIIYFGKEEGVAGDGFAGGAAVPAGQDFLYVGYRIAAAADVQQGAYDGPDHVPEEAVCGDGEDQVPGPFGFAQGDRGCRITHQGDVGWGVLSPGGLEDCADGGLVVAASLFKAAEIMCSQQKFASLVHGIYVQRIGVKVGVGSHERVLLSVYEIVIPAEPGIEACVEAVGRNFHFVNSYGRRQNGI